MNDVYQRLLGELEYPMLLQGDAPKTALLEEFRLTPKCRAVCHFFILARG